MSDDDMIVGTLSAVHPLVLEWRGRHAVIESLAEEINASLRLTSDMAFATEFFEDKRVPGTSPVDYLNRVIPVGRDRACISGIRFKGGDDRAPFVAVFAHSFSVNDAESVHTARATIAAAFARFRPMWISLRVGSHKPAPWLTDAAPELRYWGAPLGTLRARPRPTRYRCIRLRRTDDIAFYESYRAIYEELFASGALDRRDVPVATAAELQGVATSGHLFEVFCDDTWIGITGVIPGEEYGIRGQCIFEEVITRQYRGRGLGASMLRHLIESIGARDDELLYATIQSSNHPSSRTARAAGMVELGGYWYLPV